MQPITYYTKKQNLVEKWICDLGFRVKSEVDVENYRVDLVVSEMKMIIEIDGPTHKKLKSEGELITNKSSKVSKRDLVLLEYYPNGVFHIPVSIEEELFKEVFMSVLEGFG
jgi:hypothetical protein